MNDALLFGLMSLAGYRVTRLIVMDTFPPIAAVRRVLAGDPDENVRRARWSPEWLAELVTCPWCMSVWVAGGLTLIIDIVHGLPLPLLWWPAVAAAAVWISHLEDYFDRGE